MVISEELQRFKRICAICGTFTDKKIDKISKEYSIYSRTRFKYGARFRLLTPLYGIPAGVCLTIVAEWPRTRVEWDKWGQLGTFGQREVRETEMSMDLDSIIELLDG